MKNKLLLLSGTGISRLGDFMYLIALNLMVLNSTNSPAAVAGLWIVGPIATVVTKIWSGSIVDRLNKRSIMLITDIIRAALIGCIPLFDSIWAIYIFIFLTRIATSFFDPASFTYKTMLIPAEERAQFNAWNSLFTNGAFIIGPALAGILLTTYSAAFVIYCNSLSFLLFSFTSCQTLHYKQSKKKRLQILSYKHYEVIGNKFFHSLELKLTLFSYSFYFKLLCLSLWHSIHKKLFSQNKYCFYPI